MRFPPEFESAYPTQTGVRRQRQLALVVFAGLAATCGFTFFSLPLHADIAPEFLRGRRLCARPVDHLPRRLGDAQITALQDIQADLQRLALTDPLTRLQNRRHWADCRVVDVPLALLILDIDHFKPYNDG